MKSTGRAVGIPQAVEKMTGTPAGQKLGQALRIAQKELIPRTLIPREAAAWIQEAKSGIAWSARENEDLMRTIRAGGTSKYQDGFIVQPEGTVPAVQQEMSRGQIRWTCPRFDSTETLSRQLNPLSPGA